MAATWMSASCTCGPAPIYSHTVTDGQLETPGNRLRMESMKDEMNGKIHNRVNEQLETPANRFAKIGKNTMNGPENGELETPENRLKFDE